MPGQPKPFAARQGINGANATNLANRTDTIETSWGDWHCAIVVGDIHLHVGTDNRVVADLTRLLQHAFERSEVDAVVFNGDTFDLDRVAGQKGRGVGSAQTVARLQRILQRFSLFVEAIDKFCTRGEVVFVAGNHDAELLVSEVGDCLLGAFEHASHVRIVQAIRGKTCVIEHGHQVDPDAAFYPDPLTALGKFRLSAFPLASLITRELLSNIPKFGLAGDNHQPPLRVLCRVVRDYGMASLPMIFGYPVAAVRIVGHAVMARIRGDADTRGKSSMGSPVRVARRLYIDRYFTTVLLVVLVIGLAFGWVAKWGAWIAVVAAVFVAIPPSRRKQFAYRDAKTGEALANGYVREGAGLIVLGHTHQAFVNKITGPQGRMATYANHGAFSLRVPYESAETNAKSAGYRTYLMVHDGVRCELCRCESQPCELYDTANE